MKNATFVELAALYQVTINNIEVLDAKIAECLDNGDKSSARSFEWTMGQYLYTLFEIEQILELREDF